MRTTCFSGLAVLICSTGWAADFHPLDVKTGQWETTMHSQSSGAPPIPPEVLNQMTTEQRAKLEERMKASMGPRTTVAKTCITKDKLNQPLDLGKEDKSCTRTMVTSTSSRQEVRFECTTAGMKSSGSMRIDVVNSETIKAAMQMTMGDGGHTSNTNMDFGAKWLGAACSEKDGK